MQKVTDNIFLLVLFAMLGTLLLAASFIFFFVRYQRNIARQKETMQKAELDHREQLLNATLLSQEEERKRIGRDLHDDVGASLSNLKMIMAQSDDTTGKHKPLIDNIISTVRNISHSLSPPGLELFGLDFTLHELLDSFNRSGEVRFHFDNELGAALDVLDKKTALALFRVIQELLSNTIKHANAKNVRIAFFAEGNNRVLTYSDDGKGMPAGKEKKQGMGMGMQNIEARLRMIQATFAITSEEGKGFLIKIVLPAILNQV